MVTVVGLDQIKDHVVEYVNRAQDDVAAALVSHAADVTAEMRGMAPWSDRTGEARQYLEATVQPVGSGQFTADSAGLTIPVSGVDQGINFVLSGNSDHNLFLEVREGGKDGVILPTFYREQAVVVEIVQKALDK